METTQENKTPTLKESIEQLIKDNDYEVLVEKDIYNDPSNDLVSLFQILNDEGDINFTLQNTNAGGDWWMQADYYSDHIHHTVIMDYDFQTNFENVDEIVSAIQTVEEEINKFNKRFEINDDIIDAIDTMVNYDFSDEEKDYEASDNPEGHIFESITLLEKFVKGYKASK